MNTSVPAVPQSEELVTPELTEEAAKEVTRLFSDSSFMVVEDDPRAVDKITQALQEKRGTQELEEDSGIGIAWSIAEVEPNFKKIMEKASQSQARRIIVIEDMELPLTEEGGLATDGGIRAMVKMVQMVNAWNNEHSDRSPLRLEIIMNSTMGVDMVSLNQRLGGDYIKEVVRPSQEDRGPRQKQDVVQDIEGLFRKHLEGQSKDGIGEKRASVAQAVTAIAAAEGLKERPRIEDLKFISIDGDPSIPDWVVSDLKNGLNMKGSLGSSRSVEGGIKLVRSLAEKRVGVDLIIMGMGLCWVDDNSSTSLGNHREFLAKFKALKIDPLYRDALGETKVVMYSSEFDPESLTQLQQEYDFVVGGVSKAEHISGKLRGILTDAGVVNPERSEAL